MKIGGAVGFNNIEQLEEILTEQKISFPVELGLPWNWSTIIELTENFNKIVSLLRMHKTKILSIHAPAGIRLSSGNFLGTALIIKRLFEILGLNADTAVTLHPERFFNRNYKIIGQRIARDYIDVADPKGEYICVETFGSPQRLFTPYEIIGNNLPMVLDTSHIHDTEASKSIISSYVKNIKTVHLSAFTDTEQHLPIDEDCLKIIDLLKAKSYTGNIILEYMPWHHYRVRSDIKLLNKYIKSKEKKTVKIPPVDNKYRDSPEHWDYK